MKRILYRLLFVVALYKIGYYIGSYSTLKDVKSRAFTFILNEKDTNDMNFFNYILYGEVGKVKFEKEFEEIKNSKPMQNYYKLHLDPKYVQRNN